jgi:hypothetical protein
LSLAIRQGESQAGGLSLARIRLGEERPQAKRTKAPPCRANNRLGPGVGMFAAARKYLKFLQKSLTDCRYHYRIGKEYRAISPEGKGKDRLKRILLTRKFLLLTVG